MQYYASLSAEYLTNLSDKLHFIMKQSRIQNVWRLLEDNDQ